MSRGIVPVDTTNTDLREWLLVGLMGLVSVATFAIVMIIEAQGRQPDEVVTMLLSYVLGVISTLAGQKGTKLFTSPQVPTAPTIPSAGLSDEEVAILRSLLSKANAPAKIDVGAKPNADQTQAS